MKTSYHVPPLVRSLTRISIVCLATQTALQAAELKYSLLPEAENAQLGSRTIAVGDLDGDGITEIAVADQSFSPTESGFFGSGIVYLLNGSDGSRIRSYQGEPGRSQNFGFSMAALDADGDEIPDLAVGATGQADESGFGAGAVWIYSGADGSLISTTLGPSSSSYGSSLANAGDYDGDGLDELFVGAPFARSVHLQSSEDGRALLSIDSTLMGFGNHLVALDDVDEDGLPEVAVSAPDDNRLTGKVLIFRSSDQEAIAEMTGAGYYNGLGYSLATVDDADGDDHRDLMIGSYSGGTCLIASGQDLSIIADLSTLPYGVTAGGGFDADGDGISDWLIGSSRLSLIDGMFFGGVRILSGADQSEIFSTMSPTPNDQLGNRLSVLPGFGIAIGGFNFVQIWEFEQFDSNPDTDGDSIPDDADVVIESDMSPSLILLGVDSGVENRVNEKGRTLADRFTQYSDPQNRRQTFRYFVHINVKVAALRRNKVISKNEAKAMHRASVIGLFRNLRKR